MNGPGSLFANESFLGISSHPRNDFGNFFGSAVTKPASSVTPRHPLEGTHELRQACQICFIKSGQDQTKEPVNNLRVLRNLQICVTLGSLFEFFLKQQQLLIRSL